MLNQLASLNWESRCLGSIDLDLELDQSAWPVRDDQLNAEYWNNLEKLSGSRKTGEVTVKILPHEYNVLSW